MRTFALATAMTATAAAQSIPNSGFGILEGSWEESGYSQSSFTLGEIVSNPASFFHAYSDPILAPQTTEKFSHLHHFFGQGCIHPFSNSHQMFQCPNCCGDTGGWANTDTCIGECQEWQDPLVDACYLKQCTGWQLRNNQTASCMDYADPNVASDTGVRVCEWDADRSLVPGESCTRMCRAGETPATDGCIFTGCADSYPPGNKSPYWIPTMVDLNLCEAGVQAGDLLDMCSPEAFLDPHTVISYYHINNHPQSADPDQVAKHPPGLKILAGSALTTDQEYRTRWHCQGNCGGSEDPNVIGPLAAAHQQAQGNADVIGTLDFPQCWDGINLDSADHRSHMAYMGSGDGPGCPASHPVLIPGLIQLFVYRIPAGARVILSSDMALEGALSGQTWHGDNIHVQWDMPDVPGDAFETLVEDCIRWPTVCTGMRARGRPEEQNQGRPTPQQPCFTAPFLESELFIDEDGFERERFPALVSSNKIFQDYDFHYNNQPGAYSRCNLGADGNGMWGEGWWGVHEEDERAFRLACPGNELSVCLGTCEYYLGEMSDCITRCNDAC